MNSLKQLTLKLIGDLEADGTIGNNDNSSSPSPPPPLTTIKDAESLLDAIRRNSLLPSENEEMDDVNTQDLKFVLVEFYLAGLYAKEQPGDAARVLDEEDRYEYSISKIKRLQHAVDLYETYLLRLARLMGEKKPIQSVRATGSTREEKIERFKQQKALREKLKQRLEFVDEDEEREAWTIRIQLSKLKSVEELENIKKELEILTFMTKSEPANLKKIRDERTNKLEEKKQGGMEITRIDPNFMVKKETFKNGVFKPYHNLPTMTLEEYAKIEMEEAMERGKRQEEEAAKATLSLNEIHENGLEDDSKVYEKAILKARNWDDWKDGVPKGAGVTKHI